jgi:Holliday junction resolvase RusA-like endonuclease
MRQFKLIGIVAPKARPRFARGVAFLPPNYRKWKDRAIVSLQLQNQLSPIDQPVAVTIVFQGDHKGDIDNLAGAILDALVQAAILKDDCLSIVRQLAVCHQPGKPQTLITIKSHVDS